MMWKSKMTEFPYIRLLILCLNICERGRKIASVLDVKNTFKGGIKMRKGKTRALAIVLAIGMIFTLMPNVSVRAEDMGEPEPVVEAQATSEEGVETPVVEEQPEAVVPEVTEPEVTEPEAVVPEAAEPEVTEPKAVVPEAAEPETTADEVTVVPAGVTDYTHTYHTKVTTTAQVIIKDADGNVIETTEISKSGDFVEGNVSSDAVQAEIKRIDDEIIAQFSSRGNITIENRNSTMVLDHFESSNLDGDILVGDQDALENAASGSGNRHLDVHQYQVYQTTYDLIVQENNDLKEEQVITKVDIGNIWKELDSTKPVAFTGEVNPNSDCVNKMTLTEEIWYTADKFHGGMGDEITSSNPRNPIAGEEYRYRITLTAKEGYFFHAAFGYHGEGGATLICEAHDMTGKWSGSLSADQKQLTIRFDTIQATATNGSSQGDTTINNAYIEKVKFDYRPGDAPQATAQVSDTPLDQYEIAYECWEEFENNEPVAAWYSDNGSHGSLPTITEFESGKRYVYFLMLKPKDGYSFNSETTVTVNGESVKSSLSGEYLYVPAVKTITPTKQNSTLTAVDVENVKLDYQPGNAPQASAKKAGTNQDKYDILFECWKKQEKDANDTMNTVGYWYSDESCYSDGDVRFSTFEKGGRYKYSVKLQAKDGYTFDSNLTNTENVTLNGASLPSLGSWVMVMDDGKTCLIVYGTELRPGQAVEKIDFGARINFIAGDKPSFMTSAVDPFIDLDHERWDANDGSGYGITSSDYWNERYNGKLITEFEAGKSYTYGVYFKISDLGMEEGYRFDKNTKLYINGEEITLTPDQISIDDSGETIWFMNVLTMTPTTVKVIDVVEINNVTVSFKDGDKPVFTGKSPEGVKYAYNCEWWELDSKTGAISADFFSGAYENKITAFEAGKTYHGVA